MVWIVEFDSRGGGAGCVEGEKINICIVEGDRRFGGITFCLCFVILAVVPISRLNYCDLKLRDY